MKKGTPHTPKVGHTFPLVTLRVDKSIKNSVEKKKNVFFFLGLNSLGNHHVTTPQGRPGGAWT